MGEVMTLSCTNCGKALLRKEDVQTFQKVICCSDCYKIVTNAFERAVKLTGTVLDLYKESLRMALVRQQAHLPVLPRGEMPMTELAASMNILEVLRANGAKRSEVDKDKV